MSRLLEILGRAITVDTADLIWNWLSQAKAGEKQGSSLQIRQMDEIIALAVGQKSHAASEKLRKYLSEYPACPRGRLAAAAVCLGDNNLEAAMEQLNSVYLRQVSNTMALYAMGHCCERLGREAQAVEFYQDCLKFRNYLQLPRQRLAAIFFKNNQLTRTIREYELLREEYPQDISNLVILGYLYMAEGQYDEAVHRFNSAILMHPDNFQGDEPEIDDLIMQGQYYQALEAIEQLLDEQDPRADLLVKKADALNASGAEEEALSQYEEAVRICPDYLEGAIKLGTQYLKIGESALAARQFNRAVEINDQVVDAYIGLATADKLAGNTAEAAQILTLAAAIEPNSVLLFTEAVKLQLKSGLTANCQAEETDLPNLMELAIETQRRQIQAQPEIPSLYYALGILLMGVGATHEAMQLFAGVLRINPDYARARTKLALCLLESGQKQEALDHLVTPRPFNREALELHYKTALLYCDKLKFAASMLNLEQSMRDSFTATDAIANICVVIQNLGLLDRAEIMWEDLDETVSAAIRETRL